MIIDASDLIIGRLATYVAKQALLGVSFDIVNCEKAVITGKREFLFTEYKTRLDKGTFKGPYFHRDPAKIVRRTIRGMLPYKQERGKSAFQRIKCYAGIPPEFKDKKMETLEHAHISKLTSLDYIYVKELSRHLGGKI